MHPTRIRVVIMKKWFFLAIIGILLAASCSEKETDDKRDALDNTMWYFSPHASTYQYKYTNKFKKFCMDHNSDREFDESVHNYDTIRFFGYWWFHSGELDYFWQYQDGEIDEGNTSYFLGEGFIKTGYGNYYEVVSLNKNRLIVQMIDTTFFYDDDYDKQIAWVQTRVYRFNSLRENSYGKGIGYSIKTLDTCSGPLLKEVAPDTDKGIKQ